MSRNQSPRITRDTPIGPDVDLAYEDVRLADTPEEIPGGRLEPCVHVQTEGCRQMIGVFASESGKKCQQ